MAVVTEKRLYELADGSLVEEVPGGESGALFCGQGTELDGAAAERYEAHVAGLKGGKKSANKAAAKGEDKAAKPEDAKGEEGPYPGEKRSGLTINRLDEKGGE